MIGKWNQIEEFFDEYSVAIVAVGDEDTRSTWAEKLEKMGFIIPTLVHPTAFVPESTSIRKGTVICVRTTISKGVRIEKGCPITNGSTVPTKTNIPD